MSDSYQEDNSYRGKVIVQAAEYSDALLYLSSVAQSCGFEVYELIGDDFDNYLTNNTTNYIISYISFNNIKSQFEKLCNIKALIPGVKIIVTGEPFLTYNTNVTYENSFIDYAIIGEPEETLREILNCTPDQEILGICYTDENMQACKNEQRPYIEDLDSLPFPIRSKINNNTATIEVSRGCPFHCFFCIASVKNGIAVRYRSAENIVNEINDCIKKYNTKYFYFKSDAFNFDNNWVKKLCQRIIDNELHIHWSCDIIPKNLDNELIKLMYKSGCRKCKLGIESGSEDILQMFDKGITLESVKQSVKLLQKNKIKVCSYFMIGLPWETEDTAQATIDFATELNSDNNVFNVAMPFPGTKFFVYSMLNKLFSMQPEFHKDKSLVRTHNLSQERVFELKRLAENRLSNNSNIFNKIRNKLFSLIKYTNKI